MQAADTAPTAGGFQGFEVFHVKKPDVKLKLVQAANNQPYVNAPVVLVFCMNPSRVKMNFPQDIIKKFSVQDATLAVCLCPAGGSRAGPDVSVDRYDRRAKGDAGACD